MPLTRSDLGKMGARAKCAAEKTRANELANRYGLPGLRPKEVQLAIILAMAGRELTRAEWLTTAGVGWKVGRARTDGGKRNYVRVLETRGLVVRLKHHNAKTGFRTSDTYLPSLLLLDALIAAVSPPLQQA